MKIKLELSICIVTYNCESFIDRFHEELLSSLEGYYNFEILYYDNSVNILTKNKIEKFVNNSCSLIHDPRNLGFSLANNELIKIAKYENILLLNPDVFGFNGFNWLSLLDFNKKNDVTFIKLLNEDGSFQDCIGEVTSLKRIFKKVSYNEINKATIVGMGIMAFMLTTKKVIDKVGDLDVNYPLYAEDMDWCYRATKLNLKLMYEPSFELIHVGGGCAITDSAQSESLKKKYNSELIFINKHYTGLYKFIMIFLNYLKRVNLK